MKLCQLRGEDREIMFDWINNKTLVEFNSYFKPVTWEEHCRWFDTVRNKEYIKIFGIRNTSDDKLIGSCQLLNINNILKSAELQIRLGFFDELGKGKGSEAVHLLLEQGFGHLGLQRIFLYVFANNLRAIKSYFKNGFKEEGHLRRAAFINDQFQDMKIMAILKEEFTP